PRTATQAAKSNIDLQISLSTTPATRSTLVATFAANHGTNVSVVYTRKMTSINATTGGWVGGYTGVFAFDTPFLYLPSQGNLIIGPDANPLPAGTWSSDQPAAAVLTSGQHFDVGTACGGLVATSTGGTVAGAGSASTPLTIGMTGGAANAAAVLLIGVTQ